MLVDRRLFANGIEVGDPGVHGACPGDQVVLEMLQFPEWDQVGEGVVVEVLGQRDGPGVDLQTVIHEFGLPGEFPEEFIEVAGAAAAG